MGEQRIYISSHHTALPSANGNDVGNVNSTEVGCCALLTPFGVCSLGLPVCRGVGGDNVKKQHYKPAERCFMLPLGSYDYNSTSIRRPFNCSSTSNRSQNVIVSPHNCTVVGNLAIWSGL